MSDSIAKAWSEGFPGIREMQQKLAHGKGFIHRRLPGDALTSRVIPLGLTIVSTVMVARGLYFMYTGTGKEE